MKFHSRTIKVKPRFLSKRELQRSDLGSPQRRAEKSTKAKGTTIPKKMVTVREVEDTDDSASVTEGREFGTCSSQQELSSFLRSILPIQDSLQTKTSKKQLDVLQDCLPLLESVTQRSGELSLNTARSLDRDQHIAYLKADLEGRKNVAYEAARPWFPYWDLTSLSLLGEDVKSYHDR